MTKEELKLTKPLADAASKSLEEITKTMSKSVAATPKLTPKPNYELEMLSNIENNTKYPFWMNLLVAVIGGIVGGTVPFLLAFLFG